MLQCLIDKHCKTDKVEDASLLFNQMMEGGLEPKNATYIVLLWSFISRGEV